MRGMTHGGRLLAVAAAVALTVTACGGGDSGNTGGTAGSSGDGATFVYGASSDPVTLDGAFVSDGESLRPIRQIFEGLVGVEPGTADPAPLLAESWETSEDGLSYTFALKSDVTFHDGTPFDAEAVCANFDRWYNWTGLTATESLSYYYGSLYGGFQFDGYAAAIAEVTVNRATP